MLRKKRLGKGQKRRNGCYDCDGEYIGSLIDTKAKDSSETDEENNDESSSSNDKNLLLLSPLNDIVEEHRQHLPDSIWMEWLWHTDPLEECHMDVMLNRMHLLGLLIARYRASIKPPCHQSMAQILQQRQQQQQQPVQRQRQLLWLFDGPVSKYTLRQLSDSLQNILIQWNRKEEAAVEAGLIIHKMQDAVDALFHRFGVLASGTGHSHHHDSPYDDPGSIEKYPADENQVMLSRICIRKFVNIFLVLYRHMHCWEAREEAATPPSSDCGIKLHHIMAASDDFSRLSMHWDLMPAAKLNYVHDFRGLFNCISQVVYFHNPQYERRKQERKNIDAVSTGMGGNIEMVQLVPCYMQLHPEILVEHEDTNIFSPRSSSDAKSKWAWLIMGRVVYLCSPWDNEEQARSIFFHPNTAVLLQMYRQRTGIV